MAPVQLNKPVSDFSLPSTNGKIFTLSACRGKKVVVYFYPKDNTPGCTQEGKDFTEHLDEFTRLNTIVVGISRDDMASHQKFKCQYNYGFELLSDENETVCQLFDVIIKKNMFAKLIFGIDRSTFLIDEKGILRKEWRKISVTGHVQAVLESVRGHKHP